MAFVAYETARLNPNDSSKLVVLEIAVSLVLNTKKCRYTMEYEAANKAIKVHASLKQTLAKLNF